MSFSSVFFLLGFLPVFLTLFVAIRSDGRNLLLFLGSLFFYAWGSGILVLVLLLSVILNYIIGLWISNKGSITNKATNIKLVVGISSNLIFLGYFKYTGFLYGIINALIHKYGVTAIVPPAIPALLGVSFFTFQAISYLIDVARGDAPVQKNPFYLAFHLMLFPKIVAGPIIQYRDICSHLKYREIDASGFSQGAKRFILGLGKKLLVADIVAIVVNDIYSRPPQEISFGLAWLAAGLYSIQIFFDFAGYSDMAIGLGRIFGFKFVENFNYPYISMSVREFWQRWHISLSLWFRNYLYIPLGGNRFSRFRTHFNLLVVFVLCGLWHGPSWTFVLWGCSHGALMILERIGKDRFKLRAPKFVCHAYLIVVITATWVLFRSETLSQASLFLVAMAGFAPVATSVYSLIECIDGQALVALSFGILASTRFFPKMNLFLKRFSLKLGGSYQYGINVIKLIIYGFILFLCWMAIAGSTHAPFIYAKF